MHSKLWVRMCVTPIKWWMGIADPKPIHYKISAKQTELSLPFWDLKKMESGEKENSELAKRVGGERKLKIQFFLGLQYIHIWKWIISYAKFPVGSAWELSTSRILMSSKIIFKYLVWLLLNTINQSPYK